MSNNKQQTAVQEQIKKHLELPHRETIISTNTLQTKPFDNQKTENMSNNKQQTAVEWLINYFNSYDRIKEMLDCFEYEIKQAKEMEKQQTRDDIKNELKLIGNYFDVGKLDQREQGHHIRFTSILKDRFDFYNETNGGNK